MATKKQNCIHGKPSDGPCDACDWFTTSDPENTNVTKKSPSRVKKQKVQKSTTLHTRVIGRKYGDKLQYGCITYLDPRLAGTFYCRAFPTLPLRIHPSCDGLICADGEVVVQSQNGPPTPLNGPTWQDFCREQQSVVLGCLLS